MSSVAEVLEKAMVEARAGRPAALCAIVATRGSTPQPAGVIVCVDSAARMTGTLGGGCVEAEVRRRAHQLLSERRNAVLSFDLDHDFGYDDGMICGGSMDVAIEVQASNDDLSRLSEAADRLRAGDGATLTLRVDREVAASVERGPRERVAYRLHIEPDPKVVIAGAGHISRILASMLAPLGFHVVVIDDRADYANRDRFPTPIEPIAGDMAKTLSAYPIDRRTYVVIVTRGHKHDERALTAVLDSPARYVGMIGSRRKIRVIYGDLKHAGVTDEQLARVHAPIGLDIGAVTTDEIALSIAAEIVSVRRAQRRPVVEGPLARPEGEP